MATRHSIENLLKAKSPQNPDFSNFLVAQAVAARQLLLYRDYQKLQEKAERATSPESTSSSTKMYNPNENNSACFDDEIER